MHFRKSKRTVLITNVGLVGLVLFWFSSDFMFARRGSDSLPSPEELKYRMKGPLSAFDKDLIEKVAKRFLVAPSSKPYAMQFSKAGKPPKTYYADHYHTFKFWTFVNEEIRILFPSDDSPKDGFFVEAGAFDGEFMSNSLYVELELGWKGLLIEPDEELFQLLLQKNRKAWSCHCCLSVNSYPHQTVLAKVTSSNKRLPNPLFSRVYNFLPENSYEKRQNFGFPVYETVQCLPLHTILLALNQTHVDFISLDIEEVEVGFLTNFAWDKIDVDVWIIEHRNSSLSSEAEGVDPDFVKWFESKGHVLYKIAPYFIDYIFIRKNSDYFKKNRHRLSL